MLNTAQQALTEQAVALYEQCGKPLQSRHSGEFVAVTPDGHTLLAPMLVRAMLEGASAFGPGNFVFKVGDLVVATCKTACS